MDWALDHLQLIIAAAGAVAWWLNQRRQEKADGADAPPETSFEDPELAERTRRIREEIRRKIEERAGRYVNEQPTRPREEPAEQPPIMREAIFRQPEPPPRPAPASRIEAQRQAEILEQQTALAEQLRLANEMKAAVARRTEFETKVTGNADATAVAARNALGDDLRNPDVLRRAFILREVLGPPVALR